MGAVRVEEGRDESIKENAAPSLPVKMMIRNVCGTDWGIAFG